MRFAVVGHVEWVTFAVVARVPAPGEIAIARETFEDAAGGGAVAAVQLHALAPGATAFFTSVGDERTATRLRAHGLTVHAGLAPCAQRRAFTHLDERGERTITVTGERHVPLGADASLPWDDLQRADAVYVVGADATALRKARQARVLVVSPRALDLQTAGVPIDVLVRSASDAAETLPDGIDARVVVTTDGERGGTWAAGASHGRWDATALPGPAVDAYGCGDAFAAALTHALGSGERLPAALDRAARAGAEALTRRGPYGR